MSEHTATPWEVFANENGLPIISSKRGFIAFIRDLDNTNPADGDEIMANATFIVRACNSHEQLVEVLGRLTAAAHDVTVSTHAGLDSSVELSELYQAHNEARAALEAAEKGE